MKRTFAVKIASLLLAMLMLMCATGCDLLPQEETTEPSETQGVMETPEPVKQDNPTDVKILSWNIWHEAIYIGHSTNYERLNKVVKLVNDYMPDVFMSQETVDWWCIYLMQNLDPVYTWAYTESNGHDEIMPNLKYGPKTVPDETCNAIFYNKEKLELVDNGIYWLSKTPEKMSKFDSSWCFRITTWAKFRVIETGKEFVCVNTHLDNAGGGPDQAPVLLEIVKKFEGIPMFLGGDFNAKKSSEQMQHFFKYNQLTEAWSIAEDKKSEQTKDHIDWLFVTKNRVDVHVFEIPMKYEYLNASDHNARYIEATIW